MTLLRLGPFGRYGLRTVVTNTLGFVILGVVLFVAFDLVEATNFDESGIDPIHRSLRLIPDVIARIGKFALLLGAATTGLRLIQTSEGKAWFAAGGQPVALAGGSAVIGAIAAVALAIVPITAPKSAVAASARRSVWLRMGEHIVHLENVDRAGTHIARAHGFRVSKGRLSARWTADSVLWRPLASAGHETADWRPSRASAGRPRSYGWRADRLVERRFGPSDPLTVRTTTAARVPLDIRPPELRDLERSDRPALLRRLGQPYREAALIDWRRLSEPLAGCFAPVLGLGLALWVGRRRSSFRGLAAAIAAGFTGYVLDEAAWALAIAGLVLPVVAAWGPPALLAVATVAVWRTVQSVGIRD